LDGRAGLAYAHQPSILPDFTVQPLLPHMPSHQGPPLATGDVSGDGRDDVYIGGSAGFPGVLLAQGADGRFTESRGPWIADKDYEDWGALIFDANGDGLEDLYVASGGYQLTSVSRLLQDRLYLNRGGGRLVRDTAALPRMRTSTASVVAGDFTGDGRLDLFVGGRLMPRNYPYPTRSHLLRNDGGRFTDVTQAVAPDLVQPGGMVTDAVWVDFDSDGRLDLVTVGEWMAPQFYRNDGDRLRNVTEGTTLHDMRGWWSSLVAGDFDHDGDQDLVAGNRGLNSMYTTSPSSRFGVYAYDFTGSQNTDIVLTKEIDGVEYPFFGLARLGRAIYTVAALFPNYAAFAEAPIQRVFPSSQLTQAVHYQVDTFASVYLENQGGGAFSAVPLPMFAQVSPIRAMIVHDLDGDGNLDLIAAGNLYHTEPNTPRIDAGNGVWLKGDGRGGFTPVPPRVSGFLAPLEVTDLALIETARGKVVLVANNGDSLEVYSLRGR
jgi:hypothetical protein